MYEFNLKINYNINNKMGNEYSNYVECAEELILKLKNFPELNISQRQG
jgi:hypothetical protein